MTIDWEIGKNARAKMRIKIKKLLIKYNYPTNKNEKAIQSYKTGRVKVQRDERIENFRIAKTSCKCNRWVKYTEMY